MSANLNLMRSIYDEYFERLRVMINEIEFMQKSLNDCKDEDAKIKIQAHLDNFNTDVVEMGDTLSKTGITLSKIIKLV